MIKQWQKFKKSNPSSGISSSVEQQIEPGQLLLLFGGVNERGVYSLQLLKVHQLVLCLSERNHLANFILKLHPAISLLISAAGIH